MMLFTNRINHIDVDKVGTSLLVKELDGQERFNDATFQLIGRMALSDGRPQEYSALRRVIVTSAGITAGLIESGLKERPDLSQMSKLQELAVKGWEPLKARWQATSDRPIRGMLLTDNELSMIPVGRNQALKQLHDWIKAGEQPLINEDDARSHLEIAFGGNDILAAILAAWMKRSPWFGNDIRLFIMTDVNGVYEHIDDPESRIPTITHTTDYLHVAGDTDSEHAVGGMLAKFEAVDIAKAAGIDTWIFDPREGSKLAAMRGEIGTYFPAKA